MLNCAHMYRLLIEKMLIYIRNDIEMLIIYYLPYKLALFVSLRNDFEFFIYINMKMLLLLFCKHAFYSRERKSRFLSRFCHL